MESTQPYGLPRCQQQDLLVQLSDVLRQLAGGGDVGRPRRPKRVSVKIRPPKQREKGLYLRARLPDGSETQRATGTDDPVEAERLRADLERELNQRHGVVLTLEDAIAVRIARELEPDPEISPRTVIFQRKAIRALAKTCPGVSVWPLERSEAFRVRDLLKASYAANTARNYVAVIKAALRWCARRELIPATSAWPSDIDPIPIGRPDKDAAEGAEVEAILQAAEGTRWHPYLLLLADTGVRPTEGLTLQVGRVSLDRGIVRVNPKVRADRGEVALTAALAEALRPLLEGQPEDAWVFRSPKVQGAHLALNSAWAAFRRFTVKTLGPERAKRLDLMSFGRRAWVANALEAGLSPDAVSRQTRHSPKMVLHYAKTARLHPDKARARVEAVRRYRLESASRGRGKKFGRRACSVESDAAMEELVTTRDSFCTKPSPEPQALAGAMVAPPALLGSGSLGVPRITRLGYCWALRRFEAQRVRAS